MATVNHRYAEEADRVVRALNLSYNHAIIRTCGAEMPKFSAKQTGGSIHTMNCQALLYVGLFSVAFSYTACSTNLVPKFLEQGDRTSDYQSTQTQKETRETSVSNFPLPPEELAAILIKTAKAAGWAPKPNPSENDERWVVTIRDPDKPAGKSQRNVFIESSPNGGSDLRIGSGQASLPAQLVSPLRVAIATHSDQTPESPPTASSAPERDYSARKAPADVIVTAGTPTRPYRKLGKIRSSVQLSEKTLSQKLWDAPFALIKDEAEASTSQTRLFNILSANALRKYGNQVDAIIKARYKTRTDGSAFASGLAVQYVATEERLEEVDRLHEKGYLTEAEYTTKRAKILEDL